MSIEDPNQLPEVDQQIRINELKEQVRETVGEPLATYENPDAPPEIVEQFWQNVLAYESAPPTSNFEQLSKTGFHFPLPEEMTDEQLHDKLWELIHALAKRNTYLYQTDHLSDRELYTHLVEESLHEITPELPEEISSDWNCHIDLIGTGSEEDIDLYYTYYADDDDRASWLQQFPDYKMPERKTRPYDRDRLLPISRDEQERRDYIAGLKAKGYTEDQITEIFNTGAFDDHPIDDKDILESNKETPD